MTPSEVAQLYSDRVQSAIASPLMSTYRDPSRIKYWMGTGLPDRTLFPIDELGEYSTKVLAERGVDCLSYGLGGPGGFAGPAELRQRLAERVRARQGCDIEADGIVLTSGASHGLALASNAYLSPGDAVFVEALTWPWAPRFMTEAGATVFTVPMDDQGMVVDALDDVIAAAANEGLRPKLVYTIPTFHIPTATCLPMERREMLLRVVEANDLILLEDNLYYDLRYRGPNVPSLLAMDTSGRVIQQGGFSKTLATGLRMGWVAGRPEAVLPLHVIRQDLGVNQWTAHTLAKWIGDGRWDIHLAAILDSARRKHAIAGAALERSCLPHVRFEVPDGGIYYWLEISAEIDLDAFRGHLDTEGVYLAPGERFAGDDSGRHFLRLAYLDVADDELEQAIAKLGECLSLSIRPSPPGDTAAVG